MKEVFDWVTANQMLLIVAIVALTYIVHKFIDYKAKSNPAIDRWDEWAPTSASVANLVFQGAEWWGALRAKAGDEKLQEYLRKLKEFESDVKNDKLQAIQKLLAWYFALKAKAPAANPLTAHLLIGPDDRAV